MPLDLAFLQHAQSAFPPYTAASGTEHMAPLLYSIVRMTRPERIVEFGSGYTTLFVLQALADNIADIAVERRLLQEKTSALGDLSAVQFPEQDEAHKSPVLIDWLFSGDEATAVDPSFYLAPYEPQLFAFERNEPDHQYAVAMRTAVKQLGFEHLFQHICGASFLAEALPADDRPIDLAWNDDRSYREFFNEFWSLLNPRGGLFFFHNVPAMRQWWGSVEWMKEQRRAANDLETLTLVERHKLNQNGCAILRRTTEFRPPFALENPPAILTQLREFMRRA